MRLFINYRPIGLLFLITVNNIFGKHFDQTAKAAARIFIGNPNQPTVRLSNGATLIGAVGVTEANNKYYSFRGIPFAEPPLGELRFKPPVPLSGDYSQVTINATEDGPPCVQAVLPTAIIGSENCLFISVYTPQYPKPTLFPLPVVVYFYGGGFIYGDGGYVSIGPDYIIDDGHVIIVSFNYRLGIFGFLSTEDYASPGNYGLKDQILALKWVQQNIRQFGGNPDQVTALGGSAGAASVSYLTQSDLTKGLFHRAILLSGTSLHPWALRRNPRSYAKKVAAYLNINATNSKTLVDALRQLDTQQLILAQLSATNDSENPLDTIPFGPVIEPLHDGAVVVTKSYEQLAQGLFHHVPHLIGYTSLEAIPFVEGLPSLFAYYASNILGTTTFLPTSLDIYDSAIASQANAEIRTYYLGPNPTTITEAELLQFASDNYFNRPTLEDARLQSRYVPLYLYRFSYQGFLGSGNRTYRGVGHGEDSAYLRSGLNRNATPSDLITRQRMIKLFTNFVRTGNPTPVRDPVLQNVKWPQANTAGNGSLAYLDIDTNLVPGVNPNWDQFQFWHGIFDKYGNPPYSTY